MASPNRLSAMRSFGRNNMLHEGTHSGGCHPARWMQHDGLYGWLVQRLYAPLKTVGRGSNSAAWQDQNRPEQELQA
jgi:hypothetical protein